MADMFDLMGKKHPHMRGEDEKSVCLLNRSLETPPHAWGRRLPIHARGAEARNTPTCVGKTWVVVGSSLKEKKHPHMRGEDRNAALLPPTAKETPPHAWGRRRTSRRRFRGGRNTPTCVGKTGI